MNAKKAKFARWCILQLREQRPPEAKYYWIKRADGSVFRQLQPDCGRAQYQAFKGKGVNRLVPPKQ